VSRVLAAAALGAALLPAPSLAHQAGLSYGTWTARAGGLHLELRIRAPELAGALPELGPGLAPPADASILARGALAGVAVSQAGVICSPELESARWSAPDGLELSAGFRCPQGDQPMRVQLPLLSRLPPGHVHLARVEVGGRIEERAADLRRDGFEVASSPARARQVAAFVALGIEHIFTGWDHMAFLLGLLLAAASLREVIRSLSSFTAAHALTLALATLGVARPPATVIEPLIAASVVVVGIENLRELRRGSGGTHPRWPLAMAFGLIHGFGFAGALDGLHLSGLGLAIALASFNVGVELAQAAIAVVVHPALRWLRSRPHLAGPGLSAASAAVGAAGILWLAGRLPW
jgi:hydrogenase/urease accessory protein HupE